MQPKRMILHWKFRIHVCDMYLDSIYSLLHKFNYLVAIDIFFSKIRMFFWNSRSQNFKNPKLTFFERFNFTFLSLKCFKTAHFCNVRKFASFWSKISKHDAACTSFCRKHYRQVFWYFDERRQINAEKWTKISASMSAVSFELLRKSGSWQNLFLPPPQHGDARITRIPSLSGQN